MEVKVGMNGFQQSVQSIKENFAWSTICSSRDFRHQAQWVIDNLGPQGIRWEYSQTKYYLKTEQDKLLFLLRWS